MERVHPPPPSPPLHSSSKMERRIIEKNRRNHMKGLYSTLYSLLPSHGSQESLPVPEQVDEAVKYIKSLQMRLEKSKQKKENLLLQKPHRSNSVTSDHENTATSSSSTSSSSRLPQFQIHEIGPSMDVILITGLDKQATFYNILRSLDEEGFEVVNANFSSSGNSMFQIAHAKVGKSTIGNRAMTVARKLKELIHGQQQPQQVDLESSLELWDFDIEPDIWGSGILDPISMSGAGELSSILNKV